MRTLPPGHEWQHTSVQRRQVFCSSDELELRERRQREGRKRGPPLAAVGRLPCIALRLQGCWNTTPAGVPSLT